MKSKEKLSFILVVIVVVVGSGLLIIQSSGASAYNGTSTMPYAVSNVTHNPQSVGSLYSYIIGNTSETDGFPAYEGPGSSQNQSMPQYIIIAINPVGNTGYLEIRGRVRAGQEKTGCETRNRGECRKMTSKEKLSFILVVIVCDPVKLVNTG